MMKLLFISLSLTSGLKFNPYSTPARPVEAASKQRVVHAYQLLEQAPREQRGRVAAVRFRSETHFVPPGKKLATTTVAHFELLSRAGHTYLSNGEVAIYQDQQFQVCIARAQRTILITKTETQGSSLPPWAKLRAEFMAQASITSSSLSPTKQGLQRRIVVVPGRASQLRGKVAAVEYCLNGRTDALQRVTMYYPLNSGITSTALILETQTWKSTDPAIDAPALSHVLGPNKQLLPAYRGYTLQDQRKA